MDYCRMIRDLREDADLTQGEVAKALGTSQTMYARYERGENELPIRHLVSQVRPVPGVSGLYSGEDPPQPKFVRKKMTFS